MPIVDMDPADFPSEQQQRPEHALPVYPVRYDPQPQPPGQLVDLEEDDLTIQQYVEEHNRRNPGNPITADDLPDRSGFFGQVSELGHGIVDAVRDQFPEDLARIARGGDIRKDGTTRNIIEEQQRDAGSRVLSRQVVTGKGMNRALYTGPRSMATSAATGVSGAVVGGATGAAVGSVIPGAGTAAGGIAGTIGGMLGAGGVSGAAFYRLAKDSFLEEIVNHAAQENPNLTQQDIDALLDEFDGQATKAGLWEAGPEALSQALTAGLFGPAGSRFISPALKKIAPKLAASAVARTATKLGLEVGEEEITEGITYFGQEGLRQDVGLRKTDPSLGEFVGEQGGPVAVGALLQGGAHAGSRAMLKRLVRPQDSLPSRDVTDHDLTGTATPTPDGRSADAELAARLRREGVQVNPVNAEAPAQALPLGLSAPEQQAPFALPAPDPGQLVANRETGEVQNTLPRGNTPIEMGGAIPMPSPNAYDPRGGRDDFGPDGPGGGGTIVDLDDEQPQTALDIEAHQAASSPLNDKPEPTAGQKEAGNYSKGHVKVHGLDIAIENPKGSVRSGVDQNGQPWSVEMQNHYGYIKGTVGKDKDHLDIFLTDEAESADRVFVVDQVDTKTGKFDEHKLVMGPSSEEEARSAYLANYDETGPAQIGAITEMPMDEFKAWLKGNTKKPVAFREQKALLRDDPAFADLTATEEAADLPSADTATSPSQKESAADLAPEGGAQKEDPVVDANKTVGRDLAQAEPESSKQDAAGDGTGYKTYTYSVSGEPRNVIETPSGAKLIQGKDSRGDIFYEIEGSREDFDRFVSVDADGFLEFNEAAIRSVFSLDKGRKQTTKSTKDKSSKPVVKDPLATEQDPFAEDDREVAAIDADDIEHNARNAEKLVIDGHRKNATVSVNRAAHGWYINAGYGAKETAAALRKHAAGKNLTAKQQQIVEAWQENNLRLENSVTGNAFEEDAYEPDWAEAERRISDAFEHAKVVDENAAFAMMESDRTDAEVLRGLLAIAKGQEDHGQRRQESAGAQAEGQEDGLRAKEENSQGIPARQVGEDGKLFATPPTFGHKEKPAGANVSTLAMEDEQAKAQDDAKQTDMFEGETAGDPPSPSRSADTGTTKADPTTLYSGVPVDAAVKELAKLTRNAQKALPKLAELGVRAIEQGHRTLSDFSSKMQEWLGDLYPKFRELIIQAWHQAKARYKASSLSDQRGSLSFKKVSPEQQEVIRQRAHKVVDRLRNIFDNPGGLGRLPNWKDYLKKRYRTLGTLDQVKSGSRRLYDMFKNASEDDSAAIYDYMTTKDADSSAISERLRTKAEEAKQIIINIGDNLVAYGLLDKETYEANKGAYLPQVYLKHLLGDGLFKALGAGKSLSNMGYTKKKFLEESLRNQGLPQTEVDRIVNVVMGKVKDPAYLISRAFSIPQRDMALFDWLAEIARHHEWVLPKMLIDWTIEKDPMKRVGRTHYRLNKDGTYDLKETRVKTVEAKHKGVLPVNLEAFFGGDEKLAKAVRTGRGKVVMRRAKVNGKTVYKPTPWKKLGPLSYRVNADGTYSFVVKERVKEETEHKGVAAGALRTVLSERKAEAVLADEGRIVGGRMVTPFWLKTEAERLRKQSQYLPQTEAADAKKIAEDMERAANEAMEAAGVDADNVPQDYLQIPNTTRYGRLRGMYVRKEIHNDIVGQIRLSVGEPSMAEKILGDNGFLVKLTNLWKWSKVAANVAGQVRNVVSNMVLLNLSGVNNPMVVVKALREIRTNGKYWRIARRHGVNEATFSNTELARIETELYDAITKGKGGWSGIMKHMVDAMSKGEWGDLKEGAKDAKNKAMAQGGKVVNFTGDVYQLMEALGKTAKIIDEMNKGATAADAALEAHKWLFDYSLVGKNVRYLRNRAVGMPFLTFTTKILPRLAEVAFTKPWRLAPYVAMSYGMQSAIAAMFDVDDDDMDEIVKAMPEWIREKQHVYILPMKGTDGKWQAVDLGYFFPWTQWTEFAADLNPVDTSEMKHPLDLGKVGVKAPNLAGAVENFPYAFGGPLPDLITATKTNVDPFTGRQIVDPLGTPSEKLSQMFGYLYDMAAPPWLTDRGFAGKMLDAVNSKVDVDDSATRYGSLTPTVGQAAGRLAGVNIYGFDPKLTRAQNIRNMKRKIADLEYRAKRELADKNLSESDREKIKAQVRERRQRIGRELLKYIGKGEGKARPSF